MRTHPHALGGLEIKQIDKHKVSKASEESHVQFSAEYMQGRSFLSRFPSTEYQHPLNIT